MVVLSREVRTMIKGYEKNELVKSRTKKNINEMQAFVISKIGNGKVYKLREFLNEFDPIHMNMFMVGVCSRTVKVRLGTFDFPDGDHRVGVEFVSMSEVTTEDEQSKL